MTRPRLRLYSTHVMEYPGASGLMGKNNPISKLMLERKINE